MKQMGVRQTQLMDGKNALEQAMAQDLDLVGFTRALEEGNAKFKEDMRHAIMHLPRPNKAKGKAAAKAAATPAPAQ